MYLIYITTHGTNDDKNASRQRRRNRVSSARFYVPQDAHLTFTLFYNMKLENPLRMLLVLLFAIVHHHIIIIYFLCIHNDTGSSTRPINIFPLESELKLHFVHHKYELDLMPLSLTHSLFLFLYRVSIQIHHHSIENKPRNVYSIVCWLMMTQ